MIEQRNTRRNQKLKVFSEIDCEIKLPIKGRPKMPPVLSTDQSVFGIKSDSEGNAYHLCEDLGEMQKFYDGHAGKPDITIGWASGCTPTKPWEPPEDGKSYLTV